MWVRLGIIAGRMLLRLLLRLLPVIALAAAAMVRRYRWPLYYRALAFKPARFNLAVVPAMVLGSVGGLVVAAVGLYLLVTHLAPRP